MPKTRALPLKSALSAVPILTGHWEHLLYTHYVGLPRNLLGEVSTISALTGTQYLLHLFNNDSKIPIKEREPQPENYHLMFNMTELVHSLYNHLSNSTQLEQSR